MGNRKTTFCILQHSLMSISNSYTPGKHLEMNTIIIVLLISAGCESTDRLLDLFSHQGQLQLMKTEFFLSGDTPLCCSAFAGLPNTWQGATNPPELKHF